LILVGLFWLAWERRWAALLFLTGAVILYWLPHVLLSPVLRYRWTTETCLLAVVAYGLAATAARLRRTATTRPTAPPGRADEPAP
jgi:hypothetical protein